MRAFQKILFPVDMSDSCTATAPFVDAMARKYNAELTLLHVLEMPSGLIPDWYGGTVPVIDTGAIWQAQTEAAQSYLNDKFQGLKVRRVVVEGDAAQAIDDYARENGADLIMMATHGYGVFRTLLLGSVTAKVLHDTHCPVWTGVHVEDTPAVSPDFTSIMCAVDRTEDSVATMRFACRLAQDNHAKLVLVHAIPGAEVAPEKYSTPIFASTWSRTPEKPSRSCRKPPAWPRRFAWEREKYRTWCGIPRWATAPTWW